MRAVLVLMLVAAVVLEELAPAVANSGNVRIVVVKLKKKQKIIEKLNCVEKGATTAAPEMTMTAASTTAASTTEAATTEAATTAAATTAAATTAAATTAASTTEAATTEAATTAAATTAAATTEAAATKPTYGYGYS